MVKFNEGAIERALKQAVAKHEDEVNRVLQDTIWEVRNEMVGQPADGVHAELVRRLSQRIQGFKPNQAQLRRVAEAIETDELTR